MRMMAAALLALTLAACGKEQAAKPAAEAVEFEVLAHGTEVDLAAYVKTGRVTVFDFYADWCAPCKQVERSLKDMKRLYGDRLQVYQLDLVNWDSALAKAHQIRDLPYLIVYGEDGTRLKAGPSNGVLPDLVKRLNQPSDL